MVGFQSTGMARKTVKTFNREFKLGAWLHYLGKAPGWLADEIGINEGYVSELISGKKTNPGIGILLQMSDKLGVTVNQLFEDPPKRDVGDTLRRLSPTQFQILQSLLDEFPGRPPKTPRRK